MAKDDSRKKSAAPKAKVKVKAKVKAKVKVKAKSSTATNKSESRNRSRSKRKSSPERRRVSKASAAGPDDETVRRAEEAQRRLYEQATRDPLTRVYLRAYFHERLKEDIAHALRHKQPLSVLLVRVDHYDEIVRTRGSLEGDRVLRNVARAISAIINVDDVLARYGSERFALLARATELPVGMELADRVKLAVASVRPVDDGAAIVPSVTIGVACSSELGAVAGEHAARLVTLAAERIT